jgi:hypothetical protein
MVLAGLMGEVSVSEAGQAPAVSAAAGAAPAAAADNTAGLHERNPRYQLMVGAVECSCRLMVLKDAPSASIRINRARNTYPVGRERDGAMPLNSPRCSSFSTTSLVGMKTLMLAQLVA